MTRARTLALPLALVATLTACGGGSNDAGPQVPAPTTAPTNAPTPTSSCVAAPPTAPAPAGASTDLSVKPAVTVADTPPPCDLQTIDLVVGKGTEAKDGSSVAVKYLGLLYAGGKEFDSSWSRGPTQTLPFTIGGGVIPGFSNGTKGMRVGGRREIVIPSKDGYGADGSPPVIPPNADLIFVVDLVKVG